MNLRVVLVLFAILLGLVLVPSVMLAQGTDLGTIRGTVTDGTGAVIPGANVLITDLKTATTRTAVSNGAGAYEVFGLNSGTYDIKVSATGFRAIVLQGVQVSSSNVATADVILAVAAAGATVDVTTDAAEINTEDQVISQTLSSQSVVELPRDSRDVYQFAYLNPNVTQGARPGEFKFIGSQSYGAAFTVDGQRANGGIFGSHTASQPTLDAVGDINIMSSDFNAEFAGISNIRITTKRGGAEYHGSINYENSNSALAAWTVQDKNAKASFSPSAFQSKYPTPFFNNNVITGSLGGPLKPLKDTWFFVSFEKNYNAQPVAMTPSSSLPHPTLLTGDFSLVNDSGKPLVPASILAQMTPGEIASDTVGGLGTNFITIPQRFLNPDVQKLVQKYFPPIGTTAPILANSGRVPSYQTVVSGLMDQDLGTVRVDHNLGSNDRLFVAYNTGNYSDNTLQLVQTPYTGLGSTLTDRRNHTVSGSYIKVFTPHVINEARGGFNREYLFRHSNTTLEGFLSGIGFTGDQINSYGSVVGQSELASHGHMAVSFSNTFATFNNGGRNTDRPMSQNLVTLGDTLTWVAGRHNMRMGFDTVRNQGKDGFAVNRGSPRGIITYKGSATTPLANFLMGLAPSSVTYVMQPRGPMDVHNWEHGVFFQDNWQVTPRLTLNLGLRYEVSTPFTDKGDLLVNFDPNYVDKTTGRAGRFLVPSTKTLAYLQPSIISYGVVTASDSHLGISNGLVRQAWDKIAPRVGFAWRLGDKMVVRGGWGLYYPTSAAQGIRDPLATNTFNQAVTKVMTNPWPTPTSGSSTMFTGGNTNTFGNTPTASAVDINIKDPRVHQFNVSLEREIGWASTMRVSYLGSVMHRLIARSELEAFAPSDTPVGLTTGGDGSVICQLDNSDCNYTDAELARMRFPEIPDGIPVWNNSGHGRSNAFQVEFNRRPSKGLMFSASYTYLSQKSVPADVGASSLGSVTYNPFDPNTDYGTDSFTSHHRFVTYGSYDLPFGKGRQFGSGMSNWMNAIFGGYATTFSMFAKSGTYFTPFWVCDNCDVPEPGNIATSDIDAIGDYMNTSYRPTVLNNTYNQKQSDGSIWNVNAFGPPPYGADLFTNPSVAKRNLLQGPGAWGLNLGVRKSFKLGERFTLTTIIDINNVLNHPLFMPTQDYAGGGGNFTKVGDFNLRWDPNNGHFVPYQADDITLNPMFGKLNQVYSQEGVNGRRTIRLKARLSF